MLRGHKERFRAVAWSYEALCLLEYVSALVYMTEDELRLHWFLVNIPGVYILLGKRAGAAITLLSVLTILSCNPYLLPPHSVPAMTTASIGMLYTVMFFHLYADRSLSYFVRMCESNARLYTLAMHDALTGVFNARAYYGCANA